MGKNQVRFAVLFLGLLILDRLIVGGGATLLAKESQTAGVGGKVQRVSDDGITLSLLRYGHTGPPKLERFGLTTRTKITLDGRVSKPSDISPGMRVSLTYDKTSKEAITIKRTAAKTDSSETESGRTEAGEGDDTSQLVVKCQELCEALTKDFKRKDAGSKAAIAVLEFSDLSGGVTDFGRLLSEELITNLLATGNYPVNERRLLDKLMVDNKLKAQGFIEPEAAKKLGKIVGADAVISGTVADAGGSLRVHARLISAEDGRILAGAAVTIIKDDGVRALLSGGGNPRRALSSSSHDSGTKNPAGGLPYREDFSRYDQGERTNWGPRATVRVGSDDRNWLVPSANGPNPIGLDVELPVNSYIEFEYQVQRLDSGKGGKVRSGISFFDENKKPYRIEWVIEIYQPGYLASNTLTLPGGATQSLNEGAGGVGRDGVGTLRILKKADTVEVDTRPSGGGRFGPPSFGAPPTTGNVSDFGQFTRFEIDLYKGSNTILSITNIRVGNLDTSGTRPKPKPTGR